LNYKRHDTLFFVIMCYITAAWKCPPTRLPRCAVTISGHFEADRRLLLLWNEI